MTAPVASPAAPATFDSFRAELTRLVERFDRQHPTFTSPDYNEATLRADFLDPFFRALGWDVGNQKGLIHTEREVDIEVRTPMSGRQTRADYVFRIARTDRFTCEAKKPAEALHDRHIFQAKRDAFNRGIPLALLSDFEELKIFVVGARPILDEPHTGEWKVLHFRQYSDAARELWDLLAYENVAAGSVDRLIDSLPKRPLKLKGRQGYLIKPDRTRALDSDFLNFLDGVRQQLGSDLLKHNDRDDLLQGHRLNEAAQRIIDRLVFLRICEDRGIDTGTLLETLFRDWFRQQPESRQPKLRKVSHQTNLRFTSAAEEDSAAYDSARRTPSEGGLYRELTEHIRALDQRPPSYKPFFNGQLFKPHFSEDLVVGDEWLANFILDLTSDDSGYNFADIKVEILGDAYERFLGHILVPKGRGTAIEEKPEVRKAGGVYYTPRYITDYIVEQTIGRLLDGKTPKEVEKLRFLDPACGSGSFLIRAYERVMEHYLRYFTANPEKRRKDDCFVDAAGNVRLTTALKRRILEANIYGADIDAQAVEVTQLSLYLKMLEGENRDTLRQQTELFRGEPLLPPLDRNIKCFNSLIGSDFSLDPAELVRVNAGDWDVHFETIMKAGGFDAVIGNPPWGQKAVPFATAEKEYFKNSYRVGSGILDLFKLFIERSLSLTRANGHWGMVLPDIVLLKNYQETRGLLLRETKLRRLVHAGMAFADVALDTAVIIATKEPQDASSAHLVGILRELTPTTGARVERELPQSTFWQLEGLKFNLHLDPARLALLQRLGQFEKLGDHFHAHEGIHSGNVRDKLFLDAQRNNSCRRLIFGREEVGRYFLGWAGKWVNYHPRAIDRDAGEYANLGHVEYFEPPKIFVRRTGDFVMAVLDREGFYASNNLFVLLPHSAQEPLELTTLTGLLNSRLMTWFFRAIQPRVGKLFAELKINQLHSFPLPPRDTIEAANRKIAPHVEKSQQLARALRAAKSEAEQATLHNAVKKTDREIDQLVYQLYALTPAEIALVEGPAAAPV